MGGLSIIDTRGAVWPAPGSYSRAVPQKGEPGSFWENRGDRFHCGIDIYAPAGSPVLAVCDGLVIKIGLFTHPTGIHYWLKTYFVDVQAENGVTIRYAEMESLSLSTGMKIKSGSLVGRVGTVLNREVVGPHDPLYIQNLASENCISMLHLEMRKNAAKEFKDYLGGNLFNETMPDGLLDPGPLLNQIADR